MSTVTPVVTDLRDIPSGYALLLENAEPTTVLGDPADCKAKSVALCAQHMKAAGATNVRLVIGRRTPTSKMTHAWLAWETEGGTFVLDPTFNYTATKSEKVGSRNYQPLYAYAGAKKFRAGSALSRFELSLDHRGQERRSFGMPLLFLYGRQTRVRLRGSPSRWDKTCQDAS